MYYLYEEDLTKRLFISGAIERGAMARRTTSATTWIEAKASFGFPLTTIQTQLLKEKNNE